MAGKIVHVEIPADDTAGGIAFWGGLFGWEFGEAPGMPDYHMARLSEDSGAAITSMEPSKRGLRAYFEVDDIIDGVARVGELGGQPGNAIPVPAMGWFAICTDPHGNEFGLWQTDPAAPALEG